MSKDFGSKDVVQGVINALYTEFGEEYAYYKDSVPQDFHVPSFFVRSLSGNIKPLLGGRMLLHCVITITCFISEEAEADNFADIFSRINAVLRFTPIDDDLPIGLSNCSYNVNDRELHIGAVYDVHLRMSDEKAPVMMFLNTKGKVKHVTAKTRINS